MSLDRLLWAALVVAAWLGLCAAIAWRHRRARTALAERARALLPGGATDGPPILVAHASQTGESEELAWQTARTLHTAGLAVVVKPLGEVDDAELAATSRLLVVASTYGEGDPPDSAAPFVRRRLDASAAAADGTSQPLAALSYAVLALGDRHYAHFAAFGRRLDAWFAAQGAHPLAPCIEVDNADPEALRAWQHVLSTVAGTADIAAFEAPVFADWRLVERVHLNPGSSGGPLYRLRLMPADGAPLPDWEAGDLVQVLPPEDAEDPPRPRDYSIASLPAEGALTLLVRLERRDDGTPGVCSSWLCAGARVAGGDRSGDPAGERIALRVRAHRAFRIGDNGERPLLLVGNGTGYAGLRAHLAQRAARLRAMASATRTAPSWLVFGERHPDHDARALDDVAGWQASGVLGRVDLVWSRAGGEHRYVQHALAASGEALRRHVADGGAILVCGSLEGMAAGVDRALRDALGDAALDALAAAGRYRRDVY